MAFIAQLGTVTSYPSNIELGLGATVVSHKIYSGIYKLTPGKTNDTLYTNISYPQVETTDLPILNPFIQTAFIGD